MKYLLSRSGVGVLQQYAWANTLVGFDYDGTLAPIVADPRAARMRRRTRTLLQQLAGAYPCVVITGRARADAKRLLHGVGLADIVGNHGIEPQCISPGIARRVAMWRRELTERLRSFRGVCVEDKRFSLAVHYRMSREKKAARQAILSLARTLADARVMGGKFVINIMPPDAPHKGIALEYERKRFGCDTALYVGDDETDEDVFGMAQPGRLLGIRINASAFSTASYYLRSQKEIDRLLDVLLSLRKNTYRRQAP